MALSLNISLVQRNDCKVITLTDTSTDWGVSPAPAVTSIQELSDHTYALTLDIVLNRPSEDAVTFDTLDLGTYGPFTTQADMVFDFDSTSLKVNSIPYSTTIIALPDGVYDLVYKVIHYSGGVWTTISTLSVSYLLDGVIRNKVYTKQRQIPVIYDNKDYANKREVMDALFAFGYLDSIEKSAYIARKDELLTMLETLNRIYLNGSYFTW
jgi:hypothetical protein